MKKFTFIIFLIFATMNSQSVDLINPNENIGLKGWSIVNDDVMGGVSTSYISLNEEKNLIFKGYLSLENNGGFASSRLGIKRKALLGVKSFKVKFRGDGNSYKLRLRQNYRRVSYSCDFESTKNEWIEIDIPIKDFKPTWRGYNYSDYPALEIEEVNSLGLHISDKQEGEFKLEIEFIKAVY